MLVIIEAGTLLAASCFCSAGFGCERFVVLVPLFVDSFFFEQKGSASRIQVRSLSVARIPKSMWQYRPRHVHIAQHYIESLPFGLLFEVFGACYMKVA